MKAVVYYFTGTGNSLAVAKDISSLLDAKLIAISSVQESEIIKMEEDMLGVVFPVYHQGLPTIVKRFVKKLAVSDDKYIFGICTCGDSPGISLEYLDRDLVQKGGKLSAGYAVKMPYNYITPSITLKNFHNSFKLRTISPESQQKMFADWKNRLDDVAQKLKSKSVVKLELKAELIENLVDRLNLRNTLQKSVWLKIAGIREKIGGTFEECIRIMDSGFKCDEKCNGCGICVRICPVRNIEIQEGKPAWKHLCEQCFACLQWCPKQSIQFRDGTVGGKRYHHPDVKLSDMVGNGNVKNCDEGGSIK